MCHITYHVCNTAASYLSDYTYINKISSLKFVLFIMIYNYIIKTSGSELQGQEETACMHMLRPTQPLQ